MSEKRCYTVQELQEILGVSRPTIYNLLKKKEFRWIQLDGGKYRISKKSFDDWLDNFLKKRFMRKRIWIHRCTYSRQIIMQLLLMKSIRNFWQILFSKNICNLFCN